MTETQVFHNVVLFDGVTPQARPDCWLEVTNGHIQRIGEGPRPLAEGAVDLGGRATIPGLIDAHVHLGSLKAPEMNLTALRSFHHQIRLNLANCIRSGVTTVRDVGCTPGLIRRMMRWIKDGKAIGPRIVRTNSFIIPPGAMPEFVPTLPFPLRLFLGGQIVERVSTPDQVRDAVRRMAALGADWIKTTHTDIPVFLNRPAPPVFDDACFEALVDEARKQNRPVTMHQTQVSGFRKAVELGVDSMEHGPLDVLTDEDIGQMVDAGIPIVPTMRVMREVLLLDRVAAWMEAEGKTYLCPESLRQTRALLKLYQGGITPEMAQKDYYLDIAMHERQIPVMMENIRRLHAAGAIIGCGTDSGGGAFTVFGRLYEEIENLLEVGLSPFESLQSATAVNARILRLEDKLGTIEPGKLADFVVLDGDPLTDTMALRQVWMVVKEGTIVYQEGM
jgi:imidazolonepropionase-like amidohydrolase